MAERDDLALSLCKGLSGPRSLSYIMPIMQLDTREPDACWKMWRFFVILSQPHHAASPPSILTGEVTNILALVLCVEVF